MKRCLLFLILFSGFIARAADPGYAVADIPAELMRNANLVKRLESMDFEIISTRETVTRHRYALTILNEYGAEEAGLQVAYNKMRRVQSIEGKLFDAAGKLIRTLRQKEIRDFSNISDFSLMEDDRVKAFSFMHNVYPYTVEYEVVTSVNNSLNFPHWFPQGTEKMSVQKSSFNVTYPANYELRHRAFRYNGQALESVAGNKKRISWSAANMPAMEAGYFQPSWQESTTAVLLAPSIFQVESYTGNAASWKDFGKFQQSLLIGRDALPDAVARKARALADAAGSTEEKIRLLYGYLQQNTRYISIQMGIGGWQPFEASFVSEKGYGDCKALSNYMYSLLKAAGIRSHYTLINAGEDGEADNLIEDFPSNRFNHALLCVPVEKDTIWLECTSQSVPAGYMGSFTGNRKALLITEDGGKLVSTPHYGIEENLQLRHASGKVDESGNIHLSVNTVYKAIQQDDVFSRWKGLTPDKMREYQNKRFNMPTYEVTEYVYKPGGTTVPELREELKIEVQRYATITGKRLFISPNLLSVSRFRLPDEERKVDILIRDSYRDHDTVSLEIPAGYTLESMGKPVSIKNKFGSYQCSMQFENGKIRLLRVFEMYKGKFPASDYPALVSFYKEIYQADHARMVLVKSS